MRQLKIDCIKKLLEATIWYKEGTNEEEKEGLIREEKYREGS